MTEKERKIAKKNQARGYTINVLHQCINYIISAVLYCGFHLYADSYITLLHKCVRDAGKCLTVLTISHVDSYRDIDSYVTILPSVPT